MIYGVSVNLKMINPKSQKKKSNLQKIHIKYCQTPFHIRFLLFARNDDDSEKVSIYS